MNEKDHAYAVQEILKKEFPDAPLTYLNFRTPFELLIATILAARVTDRIVNLVTPTLFERFPTPQHLAQAPINEIKEIIRPCGTYNKKAVYIQETAKELVKRFDGRVPSTLEDLVTLPGVSRKTANVVLSAAFQKNEGVVVDTHVERVTVRIGISTAKTPKKIEQELMRLLPREEWGEYSRLIGTLGRRICHAKKPKCNECPIKQVCISAGKFDQ